MCDNTSVENMAKNLVQHKRTKYIDIMHHFLRDNLENGLIKMVFYNIEDQIVDIFTKALNRDQCGTYASKLAIFDALHSPKMAMIWYSGIHVR